MITFFTIIIVMNLLAWIYARIGLKEIEKKFDTVKDELEEAKVIRFKMYEWQKGLVDKIKEYEKINLRTETKEDHERIKQDET